MNPRPSPWPGMVLTAVLGAFFFFVLWALTDGSLLWLGGVTVVIAGYVTAEFISSLNHSKRQEENR